jgi:hypothetical protein
VARADDLPLAHQHRADRHVLVFQCLFGLAQREVHEVLIAWKEAFAHNMP